MSPLGAAAGRPGDRSIAGWSRPCSARNCRYCPSCSEYAIEALRRHGAVARALAGAAPHRCAAIPGAGTATIRCRRPPAAADRGRLQEFLRRHERPTQPDHRDRPVGRRSSWVPVLLRDAAACARRSSGRRRSRRADGRRPRTRRPHPGQAPGVAARRRRRRPAMTRAEALAAVAAGADRQRRHPRLDRAQGRPDRRRDAGRLPRDGRPELARDRAAQPARRAAPLLRRVSAGSPATPARPMPGPDTLWTAEGGELTRQGRRDACAGTTARG